MTLRDYQRVAIEQTMKALAEHDSAVLQMPTGSGKTRAATEIVANSNGAVWFIVHRQEILRQTIQHFESAGIDFGVIASGYPKRDHFVQIATIGSLPRRMDIYPTPSLVIWDECHHVVAKSWAAIRDALPGAQHLGLTATPERLDGKGLDQWFAKLVVGPSIRSLVSIGHLSPSLYLAPSEPDLTVAKLAAGDYRKQDLAEIMRTPVLIGDAVAEYQKTTPGLRALAFCASIDASEALVARFNESGIPAAHVDGTTPEGARLATVADLESGRIKVLSNVEVLTEGFDLPTIDAVILLRPTKSLQKFLQMIGRGLRTASGKDRLVIFDHAGLWLDHGRYDAEWNWSLEGGAHDRRVETMRASGERLRRCPECKEVRAELVEACDCGFVFPTGREIGEFDGVLREMTGDVPEGCVTHSEFSRLIGYSWQSVRNWRARGLPDKNGYIPLGPAKEWMERHVKNIPLNFRKRAKAPSSGSETISAFAERIGRAAQTVSQWKKYGMPMDQDGFVLISAALSWHGDWEKTSHHRKPRPVYPDGYELRRSFAKRINAYPKVIICASQSGVPHLPGNDRLVHIQGGLEWVRDNTSIPIPPEAWPLANDNLLEEKAA